MPTVETIIYLHASKEEMANRGNLIGLTGKALELFMYACYEVEITLSVDAATGQATIVKVDGRPVAL